VSQQNEKEPRASVRSSKAKSRLRAAKQAYAVYFADDGYGNRTYRKVPIQFFREEGADWIALVLDEEGLRDAKSFPNFVKFYSPSSAYA